MVDMDVRLRPIRRATFGIIALSLVAMGPWLGWWTLVPVAMAAVAFRVSEESIGRLQHPEYAIFAAWVFSQIIIASAVAISGGASQPTLAWLAIPIATLGARFSERGIVLGVAITVAILLVTALATDTNAVIHNPPLVIAPLTLVIAIGMFQTVVMRSDVKHRSDAVVDPLTQTLNRNALMRRVEELEEQSRLTKLPVGVIVGDIDNFKSVNDRLGHARGDEILQSVAYDLRAALRAFDLLYRIGGEEFLVLLPGANPTRLGEIAEDLRRAVEEHGAEDSSVTMSFGAAASEAGVAFSYEAVFKAADSALYEAKEAGRNLVRVRGVETSLVS